MFSFRYAFFSFIRQHATPPSFFFFFVFIFAMMMITPLLTPACRLHFDAYARCHFLTLPPLCFMLPIYCFFRLSLLLLLSLRLLFLHAIIDIALLFDCIFSFVHTCLRHSDACRLLFILSSLPFFSCFLLPFRRLPLIFSYIYLSLLMPLHIDIISFIIYTQVISPSVFFFFLSC